MNQWKARISRLFRGQRHATERMVWREDRMLLDDLVFRLEHQRNDNWELGDECFRFFKVKGLVDEFESFWSTWKGVGTRNVLELGIWDGGSLAFWMEVLQPEKLVGVDIMDREDGPYFRRYVASRKFHDRLKTCWRTDQRDAGRLRQIVSAEFDGSLDLVIDDASHAYDATKASFETLFPMLRPGGLYIIEDWAWGHWPEHNGPNHAFAHVGEPTRLIEELVHAVGSSRRAQPFVSRLAIYEGFAVVERGPQEHRANAVFRLDHCIVRRPAPSSNVA